MMRGDPRGVPYGSPRGGSVSYERGAPAGLGREAPGGGKGSGAFFATAASNVSCVEGLGVSVQGLRWRVGSLGFGIQGSGFWV